MDPDSGRRYRRADCAAFPQWRADVKSVEVLPDRDGHKVWREDGTNGKMTLETVEASPPSRLALRIADPTRIAVLYSGVLAQSHSWGIVHTQPQHWNSRTRLSVNGDPPTALMRFAEAMPFIIITLTDCYLNQQCPNS